MQTETLETIDVARITVVNNPRKTFGREGLEELSASIDKLGLIQPIVVRPRGADFELVAGERRLRAVVSLGHSEIQAVIRSIEDRTLPLVQIVENSARENLTPLEEAVAVSNVIDAELGPRPSAEELKAWAAQLGWGLRKLQYALALANASSYVQDFGRPFSVYTPEKTEDGNPILDADGKPQKKRKELQPLDVKALRCLVRGNNELRKYDARARKENGSHREVAERVVVRLGERTALEGWSAKKLDSELRAKLRSVSGAAEVVKDPSPKAAVRFRPGAIPALTSAQLSEMSEHEKLEAAAAIAEVLRTSGFREVSITP